MTLLAESGAKVFALALWTVAASTAAAVAAGFGMGGGGAVVGVPPGGFAIRRYAPPPSDSVPVASRRGGRGGEGGFQFNFDASSRIRTAAATSSSSDEDQGGGSDPSPAAGDDPTESSPPKRRYELGTKEAPAHLRKFAPEPDEGENGGAGTNATSYWVAPDPVKKPEEYLRRKPKEKSIYTLGIGKNRPLDGGRPPAEVRTRKVIPHDEEGQVLKGALWDEGHYDKSGSDRGGDGGIREAVDDAVAKATEGRSGGGDGGASSGTTETGGGVGGKSRLVGAHVDGAGPAMRPSKTSAVASAANGGSGDEVLDDVVEAAAAAAVTQMVHDVEEAYDDVAFAADPRLEFTQEPPIRHEDIDLSVPPSVYDPTRGIDVVWDLMMYEARVEALREPLLVSFLHSTILNHPSLESALAFHLANKLSSPSMIGTQLMSLISEALESSPDFRRTLRADMLAVRDRDPACMCLPDVFLYFKGFHALETHRVAHCLWKSGRRVLAHYLQSQVSQSFQIDVHPNATFGSGIMLDHGTGIVVGETAAVGHNCSILHHVTLGGSGKKGVDRHPKVGNGVLLGAGASVLGNIRIGDGCQVGAGTLVIADLPPHTVAVGVPAKIIGSFVDVSAQPALRMNQLGSKEADATIATFETEGI
uniref:serine O-acetyltransferase n=1 Tax=Odontella aurita TaxID=265563 RepID=A0A7S4INR4_9STRA|mmetsp:Transcript_27960/g.82210  ORF Transcript_27960/g.82210 Transcript_27960/m.82210 type:complete len:645 (+) Transcript_27960:181-2115(+)